MQTKEDNGISADNSAHAEYSTTYFTGKAESLYFGVLYDTEKVTSRCQHILYIPSLIYFR